MLSSHQEQWIFIICIPREPLTEVSATWPLATRHSSDQHTRYNLPVDAWTISKTQWRNTDSKKCKLWWRIYPESHPHLHLRPFYFVFCVSGSCAALGGRGGGGGASLGVIWSTKVPLSVQNNKISFRFPSVKSEYQWRVRGTTTGQTLLVIVYGEDKHPPPPPFFRSSQQI